MGVEHASLEAALANHLSQYDDGQTPIVTKWLLVAETIDAETGESNLQMVRPPGLALWDALGMLRYQTVFSEQSVGSAAD